MDKESVTSPSFLQSVLARSVAAKLSDLSVEVNELEKSIYVLAGEVRDELTGRYIEFDIFTCSNDDFLHTAQKLIQDLEDLETRVADIQVESYAENSTEKLQNLQISLEEAKCNLLAVYQLLSIDCALISVVGACKNKKYLDAAMCYSKIPPMFLESSESTSYQKIFTALKEECNIQCKMTHFYLSDMWSKTVIWDEIQGPSSPKSKSVKIKLSKVEAMNVVDILVALYCLGMLKTTLSNFGTLFLKQVLVAISTQVTAVEKRDHKSHVQLTVDISTSKKQPPLSMVIQNLKLVLDFINEEMNVELGTNETFLSLLGELISTEFSQVLLNNCFMAPMQEDNPNYLSQVLVEINEFVEYLFHFGFLHCDSLSKYMKRLTKNVRVNPSFWECSKFLQAACIIMRKDVNETVLLSEDSLCQLSCSVLNGSKENGIVKPEIDLESFVFPACRVSTWVIELLNLLQEVLKAGKAGDGSQYHLFAKTVRQIVEMYLAVVPLRRHAHVENFPPKIALFYNNTMFLAHQLVPLAFDKDVEAYPEGRKLITFDLIQRLKGHAISSLLGHLQDQRGAVIEKMKGVDLSELSSTGNCSQLEKVLKECLQQVEYLQSSWRNVLPVNNYANAVGVILNSLLDELIKVMSLINHVPANVVRDLKLAYKYVFDKASTFFEVPNEIEAHVSHWKKFVTLLDILNSSLDEIAIKWSHGSLARDFGPEHVQLFISVLFEDSPARTQVLSRVK